MERINRHNYEEFFILYLDNELSAEQKRQVESFIQKNPDLETELETLGHYKLQPDSADVFADKHELYRLEETAVINLNNYQEWLSLYIDNELDKSQQRELNAFIQNNPSVSTELQYLLRTRLQPEPISFPGKELLYRSSGKPVISIYWWRAAAVILFILLTGTAILIRNNNRKPGNENIAGQKKTPALQEVQTPLPGKTNTDLVVNKEQPAKDENIEQPSQEERKPVKNDLKVSPVLTKENQKNLVKQQEELATNYNRTNNLPLPVENPNMRESIAINTTPNESIKETQMPSIETVDVTKNTAEPSTPIYASFNDDGKKNKLRGLFRKLTRTVEKTTNVKATDDDDRLLIGGLAIKLK